MTSAITRLKLLGDNADELTKWQADVELREAKHERERTGKERETRHQRDEQLQSAESWRAWAIGIIDERIDKAMSLGGMICNPVGAVIGKKSAQVRDDLTTEIKDLRRQLTEAISRLQERLARLPLVKTWTPGAVAYTGDVIVHDGNVWQAKQDTGQKPGDNDWILIARAGHDGCDGLSPNVCGAFDPGKKYWRLDIVEFRGASYIARCDDPGACPGDDDTGWQLLARGGPRGDTGAVGPRGRKGEKGARGEASPTIVAWTLDPVHYRAVPTMSNGTQGAVLDLHPLFEQFNNEVVISAVETMQDAARRLKLLSPL